MLRKGAMRHFLNNSLLFRGSNWKKNPKIGFRRNKGIPIGRLFYMGAGQHTNQRTHNGQLIHELEIRIPLRGLDRKYITRLDHHLNPGYPTDFSTAIPLNKEFA